MASYDVAVRPGVTGRGAVAHALAVFRAGLKKGSGAGAHRDHVRAVVQRGLHVQLGAGRGQVGPDAREADVALEHRGVAEAGDVADLLARAVRVVPQPLLPAERLLVLGGQLAGVAVQPVPVGPVDDDPGRGPPRGVVEQLAADRLAADEAPAAVADALEHPALAELLRRDPVVVGPGRAAVLPLGAGERQAGLDAQHHQRLLAERPEPVRPAGLEDGVQDLHRVVGRDGQLEAQVAGVAGARHHDRDRRELGLGEPEVRQVGDLGHQPGEHVARARALDGEHRVVVGDVLDRDAAAVLVRGQPAQHRPRGRHQQLVVALPEDDAVLHHEAAVVAPQRVRRAAGPQDAQVAHHHAGQEVDGLGTGDPVLEERRGVEDAHRVAHGEVLVLGGVGEAQRGQVPRPVGVEVLVVELGQALVERRRADHGGPIMADN